MGRRPFKSPEEKLQVVLSVLRGEVTQVEMARRLHTSQTTIAKWHKQFLDGGREALAGARTPKPTRPVGGRSSRGWVDDLTEALGVAYVELTAWAQRGALYPRFEDLELIRREAGMPVRRFVGRLGIPPSTWYYWRAAAVRGRQVRRGPAPVGDRIEEPAAAKAYEFSAWGHPQETTVL